MENQIVLVVCNEQEKHISIPLFSSLKQEILSAFDIALTNEDSFRIYYLNKDKDKQYIQTIDDFNYYCSNQLKQPILIEETKMININPSISKDIEELYSKLMPILINLNETISNHEIRIKKVETLCEQLLNHNISEEANNDTNTKNSNSNTINKKIPMFSNTNVNTNTTAKRELNQIKRKLIEDIVFTKSIHDYIYFALEVTRKKVLSPKNTGEEENVIKWNQDHIFKYTIELNELKDKANGLITDTKDKPNFKLASKQKGLDTVNRRIDFLKSEIERLEKDIVYRYNKLKDGDEEKDAHAKYKLFLNSELMNRKAIMHMKEKELLAMFT